MSAETLIIACLVIPLVGSGLILLTGASPNLRETMTLSTAGLLFLCVASIVPTVAAGGRPTLTLVEMLPGLTISFTIEPLGMVFACIASFLWIVTTIYAIGYMRGHHETNQTRFYFYFAIAIASAIGVAFAGNMMTLFIFYEVLTLSTFPLVTHHGTEETKKAGRVYLGILIGTSIGFQLFAIVWTYALTGTLDFTEGGILAGKAEKPVIAILLLLYMFGVGKAALMPFHRWLPAAMVAPTPVSALLHAVAVVKAGVFTVIKIIVYLFGLETLNGSDGATILAVVAAVTLLLSALIAMRKDNLKARLAYSTVSQLSYIVLGAAMATGAGVVAGSMHIAMHATAKITLFFCAGAILVASHKTEISQLDGIGRRMPITMTCFLIGSLGIIGLPPAGGALSKWYLMMGAVQADQLIFMFVWMTSSLLSAAYLLPIVLRAFFRAPAKDVHYDGEGIQEAPLFCLIGLCTAAVLTISGFFTAGDLAEMLAPLAGK
ncbi:MAG TPA: cation:proton antiporter [Rhodospirillaceae bacterium]|nr:cation:proton antiporter [Rhodospirillaceae bacterium]HAT34404.1 cation:proton antiporter [Rhodospirillaceae bacterium]